MSVQRNASRFKAGYKNRIVKGSFYYIETYNEEDKIIKLGMTFTLDKLDSANNGGCSMR